jgi:hypothetical protein
MTEQQIRDAFAPYKHAYWGVVGLYASGVNQEKYNFSCDNYHLLTALYFKILRAHGFQPSPGELDQYKRFVEACRVGVGLYCRFPDRVTDISEDEIYGICSQFPDHALEIAFRGERSFWSYNLQDFSAWTPSTWLGRFPSFVGYVRMAEFIKPTVASSLAAAIIMYCTCRAILDHFSVWPAILLFLFFEFYELYWIGGYLASALTSHGETSGKNESYVQSDVAKKHWIGKPVFWLWKKIMMMRYPGGYKDVATIYFPAGSPFITYAPQDFG